VLRKALSGHRRRISVYLAALRRIERIDIDRLRETTYGTNGFTLAHALVLPPSARTNLPFAESYQVLHNCRERLDLWDGLWDAGT
jgi:hypothetical protein